MERNMESAGGEQTGLPTKKSLVNLHKKVTVILNHSITVWFQRKPCKKMTLLPVCVCVCVFQVISAVQRQGQTQVRWAILLEEAFHLEDVSKSQSSPVRQFIHSFPSAHQHSWIQRFIYSPTVGEFSQPKSHIYRWKIRKLTQLLNLIIKLRYFRFSISILWDLIYSITF